MTSRHEPDDLPIVSIGGDTGRVHVHDRYTLLMLDDVAQALHDVLEVAGLPCVPAELHTRCSDVLQRVNLFLRGKRGR